MKKAMILVAGIFLISMGASLQSGSPGLEGNLSLLSEITPASTAFHVMPPIGTEVPDLFVCDVTLTHFLKVLICWPQTDGSCLSIREFTFAGGDSTLENIRFQDNKYHVNWLGNKDYQGKTVKFIFSVADLELLALSYTVPKGRNSVPLQFIVENNPQIRAHVLHTQGVSAIDTAKALVSEFGLSNLDIILHIRDAGYSLNDTALVANQYLHMSCLELAGIARGYFHLTAGDFASMSFGGGYAATDAYQALRTEYGLSQDEAVGVLAAAGYPKSDAFQAILPDLKLQYGELIAKYGPIVYLYSGDQYRPSSVEWFLERAKLHSDLGADDSVTPETLSSQAEQLRIDGATDIWLALTDESARQGDPSTARFYVNAVRPLQQGNVLDLQFWMFYPYNGPGTVASDVSVFGENVWSTKTYGNLHPLGEHSGDWEVMTLRFSYVDADPPIYTLTEAMLQQHGNYKHCSIGEFAQEGEHIIAYSSLNGHALYSGEGENEDYYSHKKLEYTVSILGDDKTIHFGDLSAGLINQTNQGPRLDSADRSDLVAIYYGPLADEESWLDWDKEQAWTWLGAPWLDFGKHPSETPPSGCTPGSFYNWQGYGWGPSIPVEADLSDVVYEIFWPIIMAAKSPICSVFESLCIGSLGTDLVDCALWAACEAGLDVAIKAAIRALSNDIVALVAPQELWSDAPGTPRFRRGVPCVGFNDGEWIYKVNPIAKF